MGSIVEVMEDGLGVKISKGYVHGILAKARGQSTVALTSLTTNSAGHIFRCLQNPRPLGLGILSSRHLHGMAHVGKDTTTQGFFDLFVFFHNVRTLRAGSKAGISLLKEVGVNFQAILASDDPYTILGFPPVFQTVMPLRNFKKVSSQSQQLLAI